MVQVTIKLSTGGRNIINRLDNWHRVRIPNATARLCVHTARDMARIARQRVHERSIWHGKTPGALEAGIRARTASLSKHRKVYMVTASAKTQGNFDYASAVEYGTKPHMMTMRRGSEGDYMASGWRGNTPRMINQYVTEHKHPGAEPMLYMLYAFNTVVNRTSQYIKDSYEPIAGLHTLR